MCFVIAGRLVYLLQKEEVVLWGVKFDRTVREVWVMMEEYIRIRYDKDCTNLRLAPCFGFPSLILVLFKQLKNPCIWPD